MPNDFFQFKKFLVRQAGAAMKVTTDACLFGAWVAEQISLSGNTGTKKILDIGTGTGLLSLMLIQKNPQSDITAVEIDESAAEVARQNFLNSPWSERLEVIKADVKELKNQQAFDIIISNPPFYQNELKSAGEKRNLALHDEGLLLEELLAVVKNNLKPEGIFFLLQPFKNKNVLLKALGKADLSVLQLVDVKPTEKQDYFRVMISGTHKKFDQEIDYAGMIIKEQNIYSATFTDLLRDYYLYL